MSVLGFLRVGLVAVSCTAALLLGGAAYAADSLEECVEQGVAQGGEYPSCIENEDGTFTPVATSGDPFGSESGDGLAGVFVVGFVVAVIVGIGIAIWKVSTARRLATDAGMDPGLATQMTLLDEDGLSATYLASSLRTSQPAQPVGGSPTATDRLVELRKLLDAGLISQAEHDERRRVIIDSV